MVYYRRTKGKGVRYVKNTMHIAVALVAGCLAWDAGAGAVNTFQQLPSGALPDTEVVTNVALNVQYDSTIVFGLSVDTLSCVSNEVLVAVGCDADSDGDLSLDEAAFVYGIENGGRYFVNLETGTALADAPAALSIKARHFNPAWNMMKVVKRGLGDIGESVATSVERRCFAISIR